MKRALVLSLLLAGCGGPAWDGAQVKSFDEMCDEILRPTNPEFAITHVLNAMLRAEAALRHRAEEDSTAGRMARRALFLIAQAAQKPQ